MIFLFSVFCLYLSTKYNENSLGREKVSRKKELTSISLFTWLCPSPCLVSGWCLAFLLSQPDASSSPLSSSFTLPFPTYSWWIFLSCMWQPSHSFEDLARHPHGPLRGLKLKFIKEGGAGAEKSSLMGTLPVFLHFLLILWFNSVVLRYALHTTF